MIAAGHHGEIREDEDVAPYQPSHDETKQRGIFAFACEKRGWSLHSSSMSFVPCRHRCGEAKREWPTCSQLRAAGNERADVAGQYAEAMQALVERCQGVLRWSVPNASTGHRRAMRFGGATPPGTGSLVCVGKLKCAAYRAICLPAAFLRRRAMSVGHGCFLDRREKKIFLVCVPQ